MSKMTHFVDDKIVHKEDDLEKIQTSPGMYISYTGAKGSLHLCKEITNNMVDECINTNSPADTIDIMFDEPTSEFACRDNGRGIPHESLEVVCTKIQSSGKFGRMGAGGASAGQNGVGLTAINALAKLFVLTSFRVDSSKRSIIFNEGKKVDDISAKCSPKEHGTLCVFRPSEKYMGKNCKIVADDLIEWITKLSYQIPQEITMNLSVNRIGKAASQHMTLRNKNGMYDYLKKYASSLIIEPVHIKDKCKVMDTVLNKEGEEEAVERFLGLEAAFSFTTDDIPFTDSFCNYVNTVDGGFHISSVQEAIAKFLFRETKEALTEKEKEKLEIKFIDVTNNLSVAVNVLTDLDPNFRGQTKDKVGNEELSEPIKNMLTKGIREYFKNNPKELKLVTTLIKNIAKARYEAQKIRNSVIKGKNNSLDEHKIKGFRPAINKRGKELYITEGDSALGSALAARNPYTQAIYAVQGVPKNTFKASLASVLENDEIRELITIIGTNIGSKFNMGGLKYDKIIMMTDGDVDGDNITSLLCAFFMKHMPELVKANKIYKALPPLYKLEGNVFVPDKKRYIELMEERISKSVKIFDLRDRQLSRGEVRALLLMNRTYPDVLENTSSNFSTDALFMEFLVAHQKDKNFRKLLAKNYPEIEIQEDGSFISGIVDNKLQSIVVNKAYYKRIGDLENLIFNVNKGQIYYRVVEIDKRNGDIDRGIVSLGGLFRLVQRFRPKIDMRYKGLGELPPKELWETTMSPENRNLLRMTVQDMEQSMQVFDMLHGKDDGNKEMMRNYKIAREDLDN